MKRRHLFTTLVLCHQFHASAAGACGATPFLLSPLLPLDQTRNVGLDAALIASTNGGSISFELRPVTDGDAGGATQGNAASDAGQNAGDGGNVELSVSCQRPEYGGNLCVAKPTTLLAANTEYEWSAYVPTAVAYPELAGPGVWNRFTTAAAASGPSSVDLPSEVLSNDRYLNSPCGNDHTVQLGVSAETLGGVPNSFPAAKPNLAAAKLRPRCCAPRMASAVLRCSLLGRAFRRHLQLLATKKN